MLLRGAGGERTTEADGETGPTAATGPRTTGLVVARKIRRGAQAGRLPSRGGKLETAGLTPESERRLLWAVGAPVGILRGESPTSRAGAFSRALIGEDDSCGLDYRERPH